MGDDLSKVNVLRMKTLRLQRVQSSTCHVHISGLREQELARMLHEISPWAMLTSTTGEGAVEALDEVDSIRVHLEFYREEMHVLCALQILTAWLLRPHAKRIHIEFSSRGIEQSFDGGVHVTLAEVVDVGDGVQRVGPATKPTIRQPPAC